MESKIATLRRELDGLCVRVNKRLKEMGDKDLMTYRSDPQIKSLQSEICKVYCESVNACKTYGEAERSVKSSGSTLSA